MAKLNSFELRKIIGREEFDHPILMSALCDYHARDQKINELLKADAIIRVKKGLYAFGPGVRQKGICKESFASLIYGPSCISLEYALSFHGLIPERVETITSVTPKRDKEFNTPIGRFTYRYLSIEKYPHDIELQWIDDDHPILIASPEKALCDYVTLRKLPIIENSVEACAFLESDMRIDRGSWSRFDVRKMLQLNKYYKNQNIVRLIEVL